MRRERSAGGVLSVPRKSSKPAVDGGGQPARKQYNVGFGLDYAKRIDATAETLGLDPVNFLRMVIRENLAKYEKRAGAVRDGESPD